MSLIYINIFKTKGYLLQSDPGCRLPVILVISKLKFILLLISLEVIFWLWAWTERPVNVEQDGFPHTVHAYYRLNPLWHNQFLILNSPISEIHRIFVLFLFSHTHKGLEVFNKFHFQRFLFLQAVFCRFHVVLEQWKIWVLSSRFFYHLISQCANSLQ